ncbi:MAG TPA: hypothetical protein VL068_14515 [Microthrixaceae bacterium]|nr:hypothetical protein [Microthrixaceae bacterium]
MSVLAAIAFDPTIRGILVVMVAVGVLFGSLYLIVATNTGIRNGFLISMAALTGWCMSMGLFWTIYGIGMVGAAPTWTTTEINFDRGAPVVTEHLSALPNTSPDAGKIPTAEELLTRYEEENPKVRAQIEATEGEGFVPDSLTEVVTLVPTLKAQLDPKLGGWRILPESDSRRGEAVASVDGALAANQVFGSNTSSSNYTVFDVFFYGGKGAAEPETIPGERNIFEKAWHRIETTFEVKNPTLYAAVTLQRNIDQTAAPGEAPPPAQINEDASMVTVVLQRNLGNKRVIPFLFSLFTGILFAMFCWMLHTRDKRGMAARANWDPKAS